MSRQPDSPIMVTVQPTSDDEHAAQPQSGSLKRAPARSNVSAAHVGHQPRGARPHRQDNAEIDNLVTQFIQQESNIMQSTHFETLFVYTHAISGLLGDHLKRELVQKVLKQRAVTKSMFYTTFHPQISSQAHRAPEQKGAHLIRHFRPLGCIGLLQA